MRHPTGLAVADFITPSSDLRDSVRIDISRAPGAVNNGGGKERRSCQARLPRHCCYGVFSKNRPPTSNPPRKQLPIPASKSKVELVNYIDVAEHLQVMELHTAKQARLTKDLRNLIHLSRQQRTGQACNKGTALSALRAAQHLV